MCVYSEYGPSRRARDGETLVLSPFHHSKGFTSPIGDPSMLVCVPEGTRLILSKLPLFVQQKFSVGKEATVTLVRRLCNIDHPLPSRDEDAVAFGEAGELGEIFLTSLPVGIRATVHLTPTIGGEEETHQLLTASQPNQRTVRGVLVGALSAILVFLTSW